MSTSTITRPPPRFSSLDPRDVNEAVKFVIKPSDSPAIGEYAGVLSFALSGYSLLTKNPVPAAFALVLSISSNLSNRELSARAPGADAPAFASGYSTVIFAATALFSIYMAPTQPLFAVPSLS